MRLANVDTIGIRGSESRSASVDLARVSCTDMSGIRRSMLAGHGTGGIPQHRIPRLQPRWRRLPSAAEPLREQLRGRWLVIPHGDRRDGTQSRGIEDEEVATIERQDDVVGVLILRDDLDHLLRWHLFSGPLEHVREGRSLTQRRRRACHDRV